MTGATRGLGVEIAGQLADLGAVVVVTGRDVKGAAATVAALRHRGDVRALLGRLDVTDDMSVAAAAAEIGRDHGRLDILVNNAVARIDAEQLVTDATMADLATILDVNLLGPWRVTQAMLPLLVLSAHPRIVNVSSGAGSHDDVTYGLKVSQGRAAGYAVSKAALGAFTSALSAQLTETHIMVNAVCPGWTATFDGGAAAGARPVAEGAASVVWAATLPDDGPRGGLFRDGSRVPW